MSALKKIFHDVQVNLVPVISDTGDGEKWRVALDGFDLEGVTEVKVEQSFDSAIMLTVKMMVGSVKGFDK